MVIFYQECEVPTIRGKAIHKALSAVTKQHSAGVHGSTYRQVVRHLHWCILPEGERE